jgi:hypothetical protein
MTELIDGTLDADGHLTLDRRPGVRPGRVRVVVYADEPAQPAQPERGSLFALLDSIRHDLTAAGAAPTVGEIEDRVAGVRRARIEADSTQREREAMQRDSTTRTRDHR